MRKFKVWRQILASALALVIVCGVSLNVKAATGIYAISNRENANKLGTFAYQIGEVVYPGDKPRDGGSNSTYYFYKNMIQ